MFRTKISSPVQICKLVLVRLCLWLELLLASGSLAPSSRHDQDFRVLVHGGVLPSRITGLESGTWSASLPINPPSTLKTLNPKPGKPETLLAQVRAQLPHGLGQSIFGDHRLVAGRLNFKIPGLRTFLLLLFVRLHVCPILEHQCTTILHKDCSSVRFGAQGLESRL